MALPEDPDKPMAERHRGMSHAVDDHILTEDQLYGVYLSWCALQARIPGPCESFWAAMSQQGIHERHVNDDRCILPGLRMTGPAALDYILASQPSLV